MLKRTNFLEWLHAVASIRTGKTYFSTVDKIDCKNAAVVSTSDDTGKAPALYVRDGFTGTRYYLVRET